MSEIADNARVVLIAADFANVDASGKLNLLGAGVAMTGINPAHGQTNSMTLVVNASVHPRFLGQTYTLELALYGPDGELVTSPGITGTEATGVRVGQVVNVELPPAPTGGYLPPDTVWPGANIVWTFQTGLPLQAGQAYEWRASIDGTVCAALSLLVVGPRPVTLG